ncbi:MAG TPA: MBL fold metallo-hydrolase [Candidatus Jeotgalicoccus stercoravium]|nr:MBL fold metallo-hydrolase [Candidatus Jeotgalicoccus stercoravium]
MNYEIISLFTGFPGRSGRGFLGWSSIYLIKIFKEKNKSINLLFDTGGYNERNELKKRLSDLNLSPDDIDIVFISHLHFDHCINWTLFPSAEILIGEVELANSDPCIDINVPDFHKEELMKYKNLHVVREGEYIHGFEIVMLPGHTKGLLGLRNEDVFIVSDAVKNRSEINELKLMNVLDEKRAIETIKYLNENAQVIYPGHDGKLVIKNGKWDISNNLSESIFVAEVGESDFETSLLNKRG